MRSAISENGAGSRCRNTLYRDADDPVMRLTVRSVTILSLAAPHLPPPAIGQNGSLSRRPAAINRTRVAAGIGVSMREDLAEKQLGAVALRVCKEVFGRAAFDDLAAVHTNH